MITVLGSTVDAQNGRLIFPGTRRSDAEWTIEEWNSRYGTSYVDWEDWYNTRPGDWTTEEIHDYYGPPATEEELRMQWSHNRMTDERDIRWDPGSDYPTFINDNPQQSQNSPENDNPHQVPDGLSWVERYHWINGRYPDFYGRMSEQELRDFARNDIPVRPTPRTSIIPRALRTSYQSDTESEENAAQSPAHSSMPSLISDDSDEETESGRTMQEIEIVRNRWMTLHGQYDHPIAVLL